ncbi:MAG: M15 family metallopeptidase [Clostridiales bacterium]|nr:M15 family metallopeptidase [Clostridiales bacterium]
MRNRRIRRKRRVRNAACILIFCIAAIVLAFFCEALLKGGNFFTGNGSAAGEQDNWELVLVNSENKMPENWDIELTWLSNGERVDSRIYPKLQQMFDDMRAQGIYPVVASGYRTKEEQQALMDEKIESLTAQGYAPLDAKAEAENWVAKAGYSEHETGLAVDINADGIHSAGQEVYDWLAENAYKYGFIWRYPTDKTNITGISNEPWHYRYVGAEAAREIKEMGLCLEEYLGAVKGEP